MYMTQVCKLRFVDFDKWQLTECTYQFNANQHVKQFKTLWLLTLSRNPVTSLSLQLIRLTSEGTSMLKSVLEMFTFKPGCRKLFVSRLWKVKKSLLDNITSHHISPIFIGPKSREPSAIAFNDPQQVTGFVARHPNPRLRIFRFEKFAYFANRFDSRFRPNRH